MTAHKDVDHFSDDVGGSGWLCDDFSTVGTCFFLGGAEPGAQAAVAIRVAAGDNVGFVEKAFANLACYELAYVVKVASQCV